MGKYDFSSPRFPVPLSSIRSFAATNNLSINVYGVDDDKEVIYPSAFRLHLFRVDTWFCYCSNMEVYTTIPPLGTLVDWSVAK